jgi:hypothetical protein
MIELKSDRTPRRLRKRPQIFERATPELDWP